jgi:hypothetical protein
MATLNIIPVINDDKSVSFIARKSDGVHFSIQNFISADDFIFNHVNIQKEEVVYNIKTGKYIKY